MRTLPRLAAHSIIVPDAPRPRPTLALSAVWAWATRTHTLIAVAGLIVLGFWAAGWKRSYDRNVLGKSPQVWFEPYRFPIPSDLAQRLAPTGAPVQLKITVSVWVPERVLGTPDDRDLGVMVDRVAVR